MTATPSYSIKSDVEASIVPSFSFIDIINSSSPSSSSIVIVVVVVVVVIVVVVVVALSSPSLSSPSLSSFSSFDEYCNELLLLLLLPPPRAYSKLRLFNVRYILYRASPSNSRFGAVLLLLPSLLSLSLLLLFTYIRVSSPTSLLLFDDDDDDDGGIHVDDRIVPFVNNVNSSNRGNPTLPPPS